MVVWQPGPQHKVHNSQLARRCWSAFLFLAPRNMDTSEVVLLEKTTPNTAHCFLWLWYVWEMLPQSLQRQRLTCCFSKKQCLCLSSAWTTYISQLLQLIVYVHPCYICPRPCKNRAKLKDLQPSANGPAERIRNIRHPRPKLHLSVLWSILLSCSQNFSSVKTPSSCKYWQKLPSQAMPQAVFTSCEFFPSPFPSVGSIPPSVSFMPELMDCIPYNSE